MGVIPRVNYRTANYVRVSFILENDKNVTSISLILTCNISQTHAAPYSHELLRSRMQYSIYTHVYISYVSKSYI